MEFLDANSVSIFNLNITKGICLAVFQSATSTYRLKEYAHEYFVDVSFLNSLQPDKVVDGEFSFTCALYHRM